MPEPYRRSTSTTASRNSRNRFMSPIDMHEKKSDSVLSYSRESQRSRRRTRKSIYACSLSVLETSELVSLLHPRLAVLAEFLALQVVPRSATAQMTKSQIVERSLLDATLSVETRLSEPVPEVTRKMKSSTRARPKRRDVQRRSEISCDAKDDKSENGNSECRTWVRKRELVCLLVHKIETSPKKLRLDWPNLHFRRNPCSIRDCSIKNNCRTASVTTTHTICTTGPSSLALLRLLLSTAEDTLEMMTTRDSLAQQKASKAR